MLTNFLPLFTLVLNMPEMRRLLTERNQSKIVVRSPKTLSTKTFLILKSGQPRLGHLGLKTSIKPSTKNITDRSRIEKGRIRRRNSVGIYGNGSSWNCPRRGQLNINVAWSILKPLNLAGTPASIFFQKNLTLIQIYINFLSCFL